jgi:Tol biopolymer transport system component
LEQPYLIVSNNDLTYYPRAWSLDGRTLAFTSRNKSNHVRLYLWDSKNVIDLTPLFEYPDIRVEITEVVWSADGCLAVILDGEIFIWDSKRVVKLRQKKAGEDRNIAWSNDGQIAFSSDYAYESIIYIWDGVSYKDGVPHPVTPINSEEDYLMSSPVWTNTNKLAFTGWDKDDRSAQVYLWDGRKTINISRNPSLNNGTPVWAADGRWAYSTFFSPKQWLYVRSPNAATLFVTEGQYQPMWSADGKLAYCRQTKEGWQLRMWDGGNIITIAEADEISAQWQSGGDVFCSSG